MDRGWDGVWTGAGTTHAGLFGGWFCQLDPAPCLLCQVQTQNWMMNLIYWPAGVSPAVRLGDYGTKLSACLEGHYRSGPIF